VFGASARILLAGLPVWAIAAQSGVAHLVAGRLRKFYGNAILAQTKGYGDGRKSLYCASASTLILKASPIMRFAGKGVKV
jgi:hypothetical protein